MIGFNNSTSSINPETFSSYYISVNRGYPAEKTNKLIKHKDRSRILYSDSLCL